MSNFYLNVLKQAAISRYHTRFSQKQIRDLQLKKFRNLAAFVAQNSPFYKDCIQKKKININTCHPEDFPMLTKAEVIEHFDRIVTDQAITKEKVAAFLDRSKDPTELLLHKYYVIHTSGSSGVLGYFVYTEAEFIRGLIHFTRIKKPSLRQKLVYVGAAKGHFAGVTIASAAKRLPFLFSSADIFDINKPFTEIIEKINTIQPTSVSGYAFALRKLAEAQHSGILHITPEILQSGGEPLSSQDKTYIESVFHAPVVNVYATTEHLIMGLGKDEFKGMYLMEDDLIFEPHSTFMCVTNLFNYTLPLIRYHMSDRLQTIPDNDHSLPFTKVANIVGRNEFVPVFTNDAGEDDFISPILLVEFYVKNVTAFQFILHNKKKFVIRVCIENGLDKKDIASTKQMIEHALKTILQEKKMTKVAFAIEIVDRLWVDPKTGKFRLIIKN